MEMGKAFYEMIGEDMPPSVEIRLRLRDGMDSDEEEEEEEETKSQHGNLEDDEFDDESTRNKRTYSEQEMNPTFAPEKLQEILCQVCFYFQF